MTKPRRVEKPICILSGLKGGRRKVKRNRKDVNVRDRMGKEGEEDGVVDDNDTYLSGSTQSSRRSDNTSAGTAGRSNRNLENVRSFPSRCV